MMKPPVEIKTPAEEKDYGINWDAYLAAAVRMASSGWEIVGADGSPDLSIDADDIDGRATVVRVSGGEAGKDYILENTIVTSAGETLQDATEVLVRTAAQKAGIY